MPAAPPRPQVCGSEAAKRHLPQQSDEGFLAQARMAWAGDATTEGQSSGPDSQIETITGLAGEPCPVKNLQTRHIHRPRIVHKLAAVQVAVHGRVAPWSWGVEERGIEDHVGQ